jgi:hypothetical protein
VRWLIVEPTLLGGQGHPPWRLGQRPHQNDAQERNLCGDTVFQQDHGSDGGEPQGRPRDPRQVVYRDRSEWIAINVPPIVSRELFDRVQEQLAQHDQRYSTPPTHYLLSGIVECGVCGARCSSFRRWQRVKRPSGTISVYHHSSYRCNQRADYAAALRANYERGPPPDWAKRYISSYITHRRIPGRTGRRAGRITCTCSIASTRRSLRLYRRKCRGRGRTVHARRSLRAQPSGRRAHPSTRKFLGGAHRGAERTRPQHGAA